MDTQALIFLGFFAYLGIWGYAFVRADRQRGINDFTTITFFFGMLAGISSLLVLLFVGLIVYGVWQLAGYLASLI
jgi:hypothetical protein